MPNRRDFFKAAALPALAHAAPDAPLAHPSLEVSLDGEWLFSIDAMSAVLPVTVPHTWNTMPQFADYKGRASYQRTFHAPAEFQGRRVRVEFEAVYHTAEVAVNSTVVGKHAGKGYTAFDFDITSALKPGGENTITVRVDNSFSDTMVPRNDSYDWTMDGGIHRRRAMLEIDATSGSIRGDAAAERLSTRDYRKPV